jgi:hypothetical protein
VRQPKGVLSGLAPDPLAEAEHPVVDEVVDVRFQPSEHLVRVGLRQLPVLDQLVEVLLDLVQNRLLQPVHRLAAGLGDLREGLAGVERRAQLRFAQPEIIGSCRELLAEQRRASAVEMTEARAEQRAGKGRKIARLDASLELVGLRLRDLAFPQRRVDLVDRGGHGGVLELLGGDPKVFGDRIEKGLAGRGRALSRRNRSAAPAGDGEGEDCDREGLA